jgi:hypothetical protein
MSVIAEVAGAHMGRMWPLRAQIRAIYFSAVAKSFGYSPAEARAYGKRIIAIDPSQNREIADQTLYIGIPATIEVTS